MLINVFEPKKNFDFYRHKIIKAITSVLESGNYILGKEVDKLENNFKKYFKCKKAIAVKNGTDALILSLKVLGIKKGDEIITTSHTALATIAAILNLEATPVIVDVEEEFYTIDPDEIEKKISKKTKAIIPVHIYGQSCDIEKICRIAKKYSLYIVEDCSQSIGGKFKDKLLGTFGHLGTFSFYPTKNLGAAGDGGMIIANNLSIGKRLLRIREYGWDKKRKTLEHGVNSRLDEIQASILNIKFKDIEKINKKRINIANFYLKNLKNYLIKLPKIRRNTKHVFHIFSILVKKRKKFITYLNKNKIYPGIHYPNLTFLNKGYFEKCVYNKQKLKKALFISNSTVSLPIYPELSKQKLKRVVNIVNKYKEN